MAKVAKCHPSTKQLPADQAESMHATRCPERDQSIRPGSAAMSRGVAGALVLVKSRQRLLCIMIPFELAKHSLNYLANPL